MDKYDERQEQVRGRIMTRAFILMIIMLLGIAFVNDMHIFDIEKNIGFGETLIGVVCINITYASVAAIWNGSYFAPMMNGRMRIIAYLFTALAIMLLALSAYDVYRGELLQPLNIISLVMVLSISICLWIRRIDWKK